MVTRMKIVSGEGSLIQWTSGQGNNSFKFFLQLGFRFPCLVNNISNRAEAEYIPLFFDYYVEEIGYAVNVNIYILIDILDFFNESVNQKSKK